MQTQMLGVASDAVITLASGATYYGLLLYAAIYAFVLFDLLLVTAFGSEMGSWCWKCLPQGMVSSGPYFQAWCERLFRKYNVLAPQHGFADLDSQFEEVRLSREADRVAQEQREDGRENAAETTAKADESKAG